MIEIIITSVFGSKRIFLFTIRQVIYKDTCFSNYIFSKISILYIFGSISNIIAFLPLNDDKRLFTKQKQGTTLEVVPCFSLLGEIEIIYFFRKIFVLSMNNLGIFKVYYNYFWYVSLEVLLWSDR